MLIKLQRVIFWNIQVWSLTHTITVYDDQKAKASEVITGLQATINQLHKPITRISTTTTTNTNSNSQQLAPLTSFVYPDNDQVIHIIEPPKQFQQMKKIMQQAPNQWKLHLLGNQRLKPLSKMSTNIFKPEIKNDVIETYSMFTKRPKSYYVNNNKKPNPYNYMDAYNEETQSPQSMMPKYSAFPLEILASVRKTKRYFLKSKPQVSKAKQRLRSQKIQTVIFENGHEQGQLEKGKQKHVQGIRENFIKANNNNNIKRVKRDLILKRKTMIPPTIKPLTGEHLLQYINELLKNATTFLTFKEADNDKAVELETSTLTGELLLSKEKKPAPTLPLLTNEMVTETLDNSFKATNALINYLKIQAKVSESPDLCQLNTKHSSLGVDFKEMQQHLNCVKNEMQQLNTSLIKPSLQILTNNPYTKAKLGNEYNGMVENTPKEPINATLIYDDIMSAIRTISQQNTDNNNNTNLTVIEDVNDPLAQENIHKLNQYINSLQNLLVHIPHYISAAPRLMKRSNKKSLTQPIRNNIYAPVIAVKRNFNAPTPRRIYQHYPIVVMRTEYLKNDTDFIPSSNSLVDFS